MLAVKGVYKDGQISLLEPVDVTGSRWVAVTFLDQVSTRTPANHNRLEALKGIIGLLQGPDARRTETLRKGNPGLDLENWAG